MRRFHKHSTTVQCASIVTINCVFFNIDFSGRNMVQLATHFFNLFDPFTASQPVLLVGVREGHLHLLARLLS